MKLWKRTLAVLGSNMTTTTGLEPKIQLEMNNTKEI